MSENSNFNVSPESSQGTSAAKRIAWSTPHNQISLPYLKMLRERNRTRRVYSVNPYVEVYQFYPRLYGLLNPNLDGGTDVWSWLIVGPHKAMLIGTGFGLGDMNGLVHQVTGGMPLIVVNSHSGREQVLGNCRFDTVYCHEYDFDRIKQTVVPGAWNSVLDSNGKGRWYEFNSKDLPVYRNYQLVAKKDGDTFDLGGGCIIELVWTGGHTPGHSMFLDATNRRLFPGDDVSSDTIRFGLGTSSSGARRSYATLTTYRDRLSHLVGRLSDFDYLFPASGFVNLENNVLPAILETLEQIIANPAVYDYTSNWPKSKGGTTQQVKERYVRGFTSIGYTGQDI